MTTHIHKSKYSSGYINMGFIYCNMGSIIDLNGSDSTPSFHKSDCIKCAKEKLRELIERNKMQHVEELCVRFKINPRDLL